MNLKNLGQRDEWARWLRQGRQMVIDAVRYLLITRRHLVDVVAVVVVLGVAFYLVVILLYIPPSRVQVDSLSRLSLKVEMIERAMDWIQERERGKESGLSLPNDKIFP